MVLVMTMRVRTI